MLPTLKMFDALGQMTAFGNSQSGPQLSAGYDPSGQRAWEQSARTGGRVYTFYDGSSPLAEVTGNETPVSVDTFGALGLVSTQTGAGTTLYDFDPRGDVAQRVAGSGPSLPPADVYGPYGELLSGNSGGDEFGFGGQAGYRTDAETGLCLLGQRYYDPHAGRFLTRDPAGDAGGLDLYAYCGDDPVNRLDPSGLDWDNGDPTTPDTFPGWVDHFLFSDSVNHFGTTVGEADSGCATLTDEMFAVGKVAGYGALLFVPGGEEARGAEIGADIAEDAGRDGLEDAARDCGGGMCLVAGTAVWMSDGSSEPIQDIQVGQRVLSRDPATGQDAVKTVTATVSRPADALVTLSLSDPSSGKSEALTCTPEHPPYVAGKGWVEAGDLGVGTSIVTRAGPPLVVKAVGWQRDTTGQHPFAVYNLTVADDHTYFAGGLEGGAWAHNQICFPNTPKEMDKIMGFEGDRKPDVDLGNGKLLPGRGRVDWDVSTPNGRMRITYEQHPYDTNAPILHRGPHWHVKWPGLSGKHLTFPSGDPFP